MAERGVVGCTGGLLQLVVYGGFDAVEVGCCAEGDAGVVGLEVEESVE